ncbi:YjjG family noncanonical pyrimidine nucleotidase [Streptococcus entericus]|uniref:YjjG family noncanonical pyrimidine nucleotidase n=1 Tax=Streptococcus entericus TaxID=155680 RepID=UPI0003641224|nr:YjjG family noncanonical pyrimidine nucleotidase [Streptococcus entericus]
MPYTNLFFDLDHTLLDFDAAEEVALHLLLRDFNVVDLPAYHAAYQTINRQLWRDLEAGKVSKQELIDSRFARLFAHFGQAVDGRQLANIYETYLSQQGQTYPGAEALLLTLKAKGYKLYAATNGVATIQEGRLNCSGLVGYFEAVFISEQVGFPKPDRRFFEKIAEQVDGFSLSTSLMIGDNQLADIKGAREFGMDTVFYNPHHRELDDDSCPTYTVADYEELLKLLEH